MKRVLILSTVILVLPCITLAGPIPDTGQTNCYDNDVQITCPQPDESFYGQDAQYTYHPQSYTKLDASSNDLSDDATEWVMVRDNVTGLMWEVKTDDDTIHDKDNTYNWQNAQDVFIATLNSAQFGGYDDWLIPTIKELSFVRNMDTYNPAINTDYFPHTGEESNQWWSSTARSGDSDNAWDAHFDSGGVGESNKSTHTLYVRAVRGGQSIQTFVDNFDGTVTDPSTSLMWEQKTIDNKDNTYNWQEALAYCENLILNNDGGWTSGTPNASGTKYDDWKLPEVNELQSLLDYNRFDPAIDPVFVNAVSTSSSKYWSSTTDTSITTIVLGVNFYSGYVNSNTKSAYDYVRAVRTQDSDGDGIPDASDNCTVVPNGPDLGTCINITNGTIGITCMNDGECETGETCNNDQEDRDNDGSGDACDSDMMCKGLADYDSDVDGTDASMFKSHFGRSMFKNPCPPDGPVPIAKTGQTTSYAPGDEGDLEKGVAWPNPRFTDNEDGTITDNLTGLIWLKNANCYGERTWFVALSDCNGLADGQCGLTDSSIAGDWRLVNSNELASLVHKGYYNPVLPNTTGTGHWAEGDPFINVMAGYSYWLATTFAYNTDDAWVVDMQYGSVYRGSKSLFSAYVWPVRGGH